jgi:outer membrane protein OmpA-like peptidoglycan-associated protein
MEVMGYADEPGALPANKALALNRAREVERWLIASGVDRARIVAVSGKAIRLHKGDDPAFRRVDIITVKKPVQQITVAPAAPAISLDMLQSLKPGETLALENLLFENSSDVLLPQSLPILEQLFNALQAHKEIKIKIEGHICCGYSEPKHLPTSVKFEVSVARAKAVYDFLVSKGIAAERLSYKGFGFTRPKIFPEVTEADRVQNRRVEIRVVGN